MAALPKPFPGLIRDEEGLKPAGEVKAAVNYLRLPFGNRLIVPAPFLAHLNVNRGA